MDKPISLEQFRKWGREGGNKRMAAMTQKQRLEFSRKGVNARKRNHRGKR